jgi:UDP-glucose 4-epimerase
MRVMVIRGPGFIGSAIVDALVDDGADVLIIDDLGGGTRGISGGGAGS